MSTPGPVLILGGRSDIGRAVAHAFAAKGHPIQLAARGAASLETSRKDMELRHGVSVTLHEFDALDMAGQAGFIDALPALPEIVVCAVGLLGDQYDDERDFDAATRVMRSNFEAPANILGLFANRFETRGTGTLVGVSSVAGDRGRASNYIYGSAKAGFTAYLSGLRNRLARKGIHVVTVKPGFVATSMTAGMDLPEKLTAAPEMLGEKIVQAVERRRNVIYVKPVWALVMLIIRNIPEAVFKKTSI
ncbi:MAG: short-chain dehydrogenase [Confluentimicrobium sp.]|uniref:SDR family oxidoreductase n=1 Tax=Actibacterium sp. TaxID=1872125 RepID=UPI000C63886D|nr:SDR family oxidoreductase [Actibacterium sp.]MBC58410.1 short-chain dehydrogenase [Actibacterium sp.]|tara:strand:- start:4620 stop:5360 length:741 start_codon:yes stop_codon:yes gene_type:complete